MRIWLKQSPAFSIKIQSDAKSGRVYIEVPDELVAECAPANTPKGLQPAQISDEEFEARPDPHNCDDGDEKNHEPVPVREWYPV